jgi:hypothetical protein
MMGYERDPKYLEDLFNKCLKNGSSFEKEVARTVYFKQRNWATPKQIHIMCNGASYKAPATGWMRGADSMDFSESDYEITDYENCAGWHK